MTICHGIASANKHVCVVVRWPVGGIRTHLLYNYRYLIGSGYRFTFFGPDDGSLHYLADSLSPYGKAKYVGVSMSRRFCTLLFCLRRYLCNERVDLLHSHGLSAACYGELARFGLPIPHIVTMHEPLRRDQFSGLRGSLLRWTMSRLLYRVDRIIAVSDDARHNLIDSLHGLRSSWGKVQTICNGVELPHCGSAGGRAIDLRRYLRLSSDAVLIGFLGRFMPEKGFPLLLEAASRLAYGQPRVTFHIVAFGSGDYRREYCDEIKRRRLTEWVTVMDSVSDVYPVLRQFDLLVVPSLWEASSLVSMEAMCAGVPVLGSDCAGLREVLRGTPSRTFHCGDAASLKAQLQIAIADLWTDAAAEFMPTAQERFDVRLSAKQLSHLYGMAIV